MVFFMVFIACSEAESTDTMTGKLMLAWYPQSLNCVRSGTIRKPAKAFPESEMLHRIHMLMEYSYYHDAANIFFVIQNMAFVREAE